MAIKSQSKGKLKPFSFLIIIFSLMHTASFAQFNYKVEGLVKEDGKPLPGAIVSIFDFENVKVKDITTSAAGTWTFSLKPDEEYNIYITKPDYINVKIMYSTIGISPDDAKKFKGVSNPVVELFPLPSDPKLVEQLTSMLNKPYLSYYYNADDNTMIGDENNNKPMQEDLAKLQRLSEGPKADLREKAELEAKYKEAIASGDKALLAKNYPAAKTSYNDALALKSAEQYPKTKLAEIDKILADAAAKEKADKDKATADAAEKDRLAKEKADKDKALADAAAKAKADKDKAAADAAEKDRLAKEQAAKEKAEKDKAIADAAAKAKADQDKAAADAAAERDRIAKEKADKDAAEKERLAKEKAIEDEKAAADKAAKDKAAAELAAKEKAEREKAEAEAAEKAKLAKEQADKEKAIADAAEKERLAKEEEKRKFEKKYKDFIMKGDSALLAKNYPVAKTAFNDAVAMKPEDQYPKDKLKQIETEITNADLFKNDLAKKYPVGVTEEKVKEGNNNITRRIVVTGNKGVLYMKKETTFGTVYYFKDGAPITEQMWEKETVLK